MKKIARLFIFVVVSVIFFSGCASIVSKSTYPVLITSSPDAAEISISDKKGKTIYNGQTPTTVSLKAGAGYFSGQNYTVTFKKSGYEPTTILIDRGVDGWYILGNLIFWEESCQTDRECV